MPVVECKVLAFNPGSIQVSYEVDISKNNAGRSDSAIMNDASTLIAMGFTQPPYNVFVQESSITFQDQSGNTINNCNPPTNCSSLPNSQCISTTGSYICVCMPGYALQSSGGAQSCVNSTQTTTSTTSPMFGSTPSAAPNNCDLRLQFSCTFNHKCIPLAERCDGIFHCGDGSDEKNCLSCTSNVTAFFCARDNLCIPISDLCNGYRDCSDGSDEINCTAVVVTCPPGEFTCANGQCILNAYLQCDGYSYCSDGSDELNCPCDESYKFRCANGQCVSSYARCNRNYPPLCSDGSDQSNCTTVCESPADTCSDGWCLYTVSECSYNYYYNYHYCPNNLRCDGFNDCPDDSDELNCNGSSTTVYMFPTTPPVLQYTNPSVQLAVNCSAPGEYKCNNGWCLSIATPCWAPWCGQWDLHCDGYNDCPDDSDELNCAHISNKTCGPGEFTCKNGQCVSYSRLQCGTYAYAYKPRACSDGSDLTYCLSVGCPKGQFQCKSNALCIYNYDVCDGYTDCSDGSDEFNCTCPSYKFRCANGQCVYNNPCSGYSECSDGNNLLNCTCTSDQFKCASGHQCVSNIYRCGTYGSACFDRSDQWNCNCTDDQFKCTEDGSCKPISYVCDGYNDCVNGSDERNCNCSSNQFQCASGHQCVQSFYRCGPYGSACFDGSDQLNCSCTHANQFQCANGQCVYNYDGCSGYSPPACTDRSDRRNCTCRPDQFQCADGACIQAFYRCSQYGRECFDGSDQWNCNCTANQFKCLEDGSCISNTLRCNGINDCRNGSDELNCNCSALASFNCNNGRCVDTFGQCDGINNCGDYFDELYCPGCINLDNSFTCNMGLCISDGTVYCNGTKECPDGSDEAPGCQTMCSPSLHTCSNGRCIYKSAVCNNFNDCGDYSDEANCTCEPTQFKCVNAICIDLSWFCDGYRDCPGGEDEKQGCKDDCPSNSLRCKITGKLKCLSLSVICDGIKDCPDGSDEVNCRCNIYQFQCRNGSCIPDDWVCDGTKDCSTGEDEQNCQNCTSSQFQCHSDYSCINITQQCDGIAQCNDTSDESFCLALNGTGPLVSTTATSLLVVTYQGVAGSYVCADGWTTTWSNIACTQMGLGISLAWSNGTVSRGSVLTLNTASGLQTAANLLASLTKSTCQSKQIVSISCSQPACGVRAVQADSVGPYIVNGDLAKRGAWPWQVSLFYQGIFECGGSILNEKWIVTAAHCGYIFTDTTQLTVRAGSIYLNQNESSVQFWSIDKVVVNPAYIPYYGTTGPGDIALLRLTTPILYTDVILPVCLPSSNINLAQFKVCVVTGFGYTTRSRNGPPSPYLLQGKMNILSASTCHQSYIDHTYYNDIDFNSIYNYSVCAGSYPSDISICYGDSGGPLACKNEQDVWTVVGVVSWTYNNCWGSVFTRVSTYTDWLQQTMQRYWIN